MKNQRFVLVCISLFISLALTAQVKLPDSQRYSSENYIYKLNHDDLRQIYLKDVDVNESMLHTFIAKYKDVQDIPDLPRGNYVIVNARENKLDIRDYTVDDFYFKIVPDERLVICLYDSLGNMIENAKVKRGSKTLKYDAITQTYSTAKVKDEEVVEVNNNGVYHYIEFTDENDLYYKVNIFRKSWYRIQGTWLNAKYSVIGLFDPDQAPVRRVRNKYNGFVVFSKPRYKPGETVKFKAYMADEAQNPCKEDVDVVLTYYDSNAIDKFITKLSPYRPGMYECQFQLSDTLKLLLDKSYNVELRKKNKRETYIRQSFHYEEYELKGLKFSASSEQKHYVLGDTVRIKLKVTDENEMAVYDGKVNIVVTTDKYRQLDVYELKSVFLPDVLWKETIDMSGVSEKEVIIPDSVFLNNTNLSYTVDCTFLSADNEEHKQKQSFEYNARERVLDFFLKKGMMTVRELYRGESQQVRAGITVSGENGETLSRDSVTLPYTFPVPWMASDFEVKTSTLKGLYFSSDIKEEMMDCQLFRRNDSICIEMDNPAAIPFWYTVRKNNQVVARGYSNDLDYKEKDDRNSGYAVQISYLFGEEAKVFQKSLPFLEKNITMDISAATAVYPGQTSTIHVSVKDNKGNPVKDADITAYAFTSKFDDQTPRLYIGGKSVHAKSFRNVRYEADESMIYSSRAWMSWERWRKEMSLDTIEYYRFLYPEPCYVYVESNPGNVTQISPYVVMNGEVQGVYMLWVDDRLFYAKQAKQLEVYSFPVSPGKHHLRLRTSDREVLVKNVYVAEGMKTVISVDGNKNAQASSGPEADKPLSITVREQEKKQKGMLTSKEQELLENQLITVNNHFGKLWTPGGIGLDLPAYIRSGGAFYYLNYEKNTRYEPTLRAHVNAPILAGPFPYLSEWNGAKNVASLYVDSTFISNIEIEGGNKYSVYKGYQKIEDWDSKVIARNIPDFTQSVNFRQYVLTKEDIHHLFQDRMANAFRNSNGYATSVVPVKDKNNQDCRLNLTLGKKYVTSVSPLFILITPENKKDSTEYFYFGKTNTFENLPEGNAVITLIMSDTTSYSHPVTLYKGGCNYLQIDTIIPSPIDHLAMAALEKFRQDISKESARIPLLAESPPGEDNIVFVEAQKVGSYNKSNDFKAIVTGTVCDNGGEPLIGVSVTVRGQNIGTVTDIDGRFTLKAPESGKLEFLYIGYTPTVTDLRAGFDYDIVMKEDEKHLDEVVVVGYGSVKKESVVGLVTTIDESLQVEKFELQGKLAGVVGNSPNFMIRGASSVSDSQEPLIILNGLPYSGNLSEIDPQSITSITVLKDESAKSMYGSKAANGVIFIQTSDQTTDKDASKDDFAGDPASSMRRNFHDDAFWQPALRTNEQGEVSFDVTYPDDITSWDAYFIAVGQPKQTDKKKLTIKSFKSLSARLSVPRFAIRGDSMTLVGKLANHMSDTVQVQRFIQTPSGKDEQLIDLAASHVDKFSVTAVGGDSLKISYALRTENNYFDGEEHAIPVFEQGTLETIGIFRMINDTLTHTFKIDPSAGEGTVHAEASGLETFLREIEKVDRYPYMCNEQMASKVKVLLAKKRIYSLLDQPFKEDGKIRSLISKLNKNKNKNDLWGWWNQEETVSWISGQVLEAMIDAEKEGYKTGLNKKYYSDQLEKDVKSALASLYLVSEKEIPAAKQNLLEKLLLLKRLDTTSDLTPYFDVVNKLKDNSMSDKLKSMQLQALIGKKDQINMDTLMSYSRHTLLGSMYWGEDEKAAVRGCFILPYSNNTETTLIAYNLLKMLGGRESELEKIRAYFFECRKGGSWRNTFESSRVVETILPDMLTDRQKYAKAAMYLNGEKITEFPYAKEMSGVNELNVRKTGISPLFFTVYQQAWNSTPEAESKGFTVKTFFCENKDTVSVLNAGKVVELEVVVKVDGDAEYIMVEVPIPAGCTYATKEKSNYRIESHREYFKEKVCIFGNRLTEGEHHFTIKLMPRYTGSYHLNPARVELMYFPTFYGRESMKNVNIQE